ncbi:MAG TPA: 3'-5' exonuclease [Terriglobales bacterium]|nr:3'-5' exonuclease [Terriglobales bacterium]
MLDWLKSAMQRDSGSGTLLDAVRYVVLDTELTSLDKRTNRLLSVGAVAMEGAKIKLGEQFYRVVNPGVPVPAESVVIHKLRKEDVEQGESVSACLDGVRTFIGDAVLVGHFVNVDLKILRKELGTEKHKLGNPAIDTARVHHWILRHGPYSEDLALQLEKLDLATVAKFYGVEVQDQHHALSDAFLTAQVWQKMLHALPGKRVRRLKELLRIGAV